MPKRSMSYRGAAACIISTAHHARPKVIGQREDLRAQFANLSKPVSTYSMPWIAGKEAILSVPSSPILLSAVSLASRLCSVTARVDATCAAGAHARAASGCARRLAARAPLALSMPSSTPSSWEASAVITFDERGTF